MATIRPILGELELSQVQLIDLDGDQVLTRHEVPALEGDFFQRLGRRGARVALAGYLTGPEAREGLGELRERFRAGQPVSFASDLTSATRLDRVMIESLTVVERAGHPDCFEYDLVLRDYTEAEPVEPVEPPEPPVPPPQVEETGTLVVTVIKENDPDFDAGRVVLTARGEQEDGTPLERPLTQREGNRWTEEDFPVGRYTVEARVPEEELSGTAEAEVRAGETTEVTIVLRDESDAALTFLVHFRFDSAFLEPCLRPVLRQVAAFAAANPDRRLLIVGHTDLAGSVQYNQSLSERRARVVHAALRFGNDRPAAIAEWEALRRPRPAGVLPSVNDSWGAREYQQILQDLRFYRGRIDGAHGPATDAAVSAFRVDRGLPPGGAVDDATWTALIEAYLEQDALSVPDDRFLPNCPGEPLKWLGCSELDPVRDTEDAWRPNRRSEFLFTRATELPADVAQPDTFALAPPVGGGWCLNDSGTTTRCCFTTRYPGVAPKEQCPGTLPRGEPLQRQPGESGAPFVVRGTIRFSDGTPYANRPFVLTAPDGEYMDGEQARTAGSLRGGTPRAGTTDAAGAFAYPDNPKRPGIFILEVQDEVVAFNDGASLDEAKGAIVCRRLERDGDSFDVIVVPAAAAGVRPSLTAPDLLVVVRPHTAPARRPVTLGADAAFQGSGLLTIEEGAGRIRLFDAPAGGNEITFDGTDNSFTGDQLAAGVTLFAEGGPAPSAALDDIRLQLRLTVGGQPGPATSDTTTAVLLTLDVALSRPAPGAEPPFLSDADKAAVGRFTQVRDPNFSHERTILRIAPPQPAGVPGELELAPINAAAAAFADEVPAVGQAALANPHVVAIATVPAGGLRFFAEGLNPSAAVRDSGFQLGLRGVERDGDRVAMTLVQLDAAADDSPATATQTVARFGVWDRAYGAGNQPDLLADFIGNDERRLHFRIRDAGGPAAPVDIRWRTLRADRTTDDDAPASQDLSLPRVAAPGTYVSRGVMLVVSDTDVALDTPSGLPADPGRSEPRNRGQSNHRLRRGRIDGFLRAEYRPPAQAGVTLPLVMPLFQRDPDERRRLSPRVIRYTNAGNPNYVPATDARIRVQFEVANELWNAVGLQVDAQATVDRAIPAAALDGDFYGGSINNPFEQAALLDLIPITPDDSLTVVFTDMDVGANAYATVFERNPIPNPAGGNLTLGERYFIFIDTTLDPLSATLAHELHHVVFNRGDTAVPDPFFSFNTNDPSGLAAGRGIALPDARIYRRVQHLHNPDPDNDPTNDNVLNWYRRARTQRFPIAGSLDAPDATTGNTLVTNF